MSLRNLALLKGGNPWGETYESIKEYIERLTPEQIGMIETIEGNDRNSNNLLVITGFSTKTYKAIRKVMEPLEKNAGDLFKSIKYVKFHDDHIKSLVADFLSKFQKSDEEKAGELENLVYRKCAEHIHGMLNRREEYIILGKSAGGGIAMYLTPLSPNYNKLLLFAPGVKYIGMDEDFPLRDSHNFPIIVGWNDDDNKVEFDTVYPIITHVFRKCNKVEHMLVKFIGDNREDLHELNSKFLEFIK
jgi:hypothetical protein